MLFDRKTYTTVPAAVMFLCCLAGAVRSESLPADSNAVGALEPSPAAAAFGRPEAEFQVDRLVERSLLATFGLGAACLVMLWSSRRLKRSTVRGNGTGPRMSLVDTLSLAPRCALQLVHVDGQRFLVARDATGVRSITPVNSFADTLEDSDESASTAGEQRFDLHRVSKAGLALDDMPHGAFATINPTLTRRSDPWQGPAWKS